MFPGAGKNFLFLSLVLGGNGLSMYCRPSAFFLHHGFTFLRL